MLLTWPSDEVTLAHVSSQLPSIGEGVISVRLRRRILAMLSALAIIIPLTVAIGSASAEAAVIPNTSGASCVQSTPWSCTQVYGNGTFIVQMNGWSHNASSVSITNLHLQLTWVDSSGTVHNIKSCATFTIAPGANSPNCIWAPNHTEPSGDYRTTLWSCTPGCKVVSISDVGVHN